MTETNAERLRIVKADWNKKQRKHPFRPLSLEVENVEWLIEQAEQGIEQREWFSAQRKLVGARSEEIYRLREQVATFEMKYENTGSVFNCSHQIKRIEELEKVNKRLHSALLTINSLHHGSGPVKTIVNEALGVQK